jgi:hypothetical protein
LKSLVTQASIFVCCFFGVLFYFELFLDCFATKWDWKKSFATRTCEVLLICSFRV